MEKRIINKQNVNFASSNGTDTVQGWFYTADGVTPKAVVQIAHGMCEYIARYDDFAGFLAENGYAVCGNDHLGHGETSGTTGEDGFFAEKNGDKHVLSDLFTMNSLAHERFKDLPVILLGHSMGSFFARKYATVFPNTISALIISGTGGPNPISIPGMMVSKLVGLIKGEKYHSRFVHDVAFKKYVERIENSTSEYDWVTNDVPILEAYKKDPKCTFVFTATAFYDLIKTQHNVNKKDWASKIDKNLPIYLYAGEMDPVGDYGNGVKKVYKMLKQADIKDVSLKLYPDGLHEMHNAPNRHEVYMDVLTWLELHFK